MSQILNKGVIARLDARVDVFSGDTLSIYGVDPATKREQTYISGDFI